MNCRTEYVRPHQYSYHKASVCVDLAFTVAFRDQKGIRNVNIFAIATIGYSVAYAFSCVASMWPVLGNTWLSCVI